MLILGLVAAFCLYVVLYWLYLAADSQISSTASTLEILNQIFLMPQTDIFMLLRGLIIVTFFYVVADAFISPARRGLKSLSQRRKDALREAAAFRGVPPLKAPSDDDDSLDYAH